MLTAGHLINISEVTRNVTPAPEEWKSIFTTNKPEYETGVADNFLLVKNTLNKKIYYQFNACSDKSKLLPNVWLHWDHDELSEFSLSQFAEERQIGDLNIKPDKIDLWSVKLIIRKSI